MKRCIAGGSISKHDSLSLNGVVLLMEQLSNLPANEGGLVASSIAKLSSSTKQ